MLKDTHCNNKDPKAIMKTLSFSRFFTRKYLPMKFFRVSPFFEPPCSQHVFLAGLRCPSGQLQFVAMPLSFGQPGTATFPARF
jgi:hypothetical protein